MIKQVGVTKSGSPVVSGILTFEGTYGFPLEDIFERMKIRNITPSWLHMIDEAKKQGVNINKFFTKLESCVVTVYGKEYWELILPALKSK